MDICTNLYGYILQTLQRGYKGWRIVKAFNQRGAVICGARVWERIMPGAVYVDHGSRGDSILPGKLDRGGAINLISPDGIISRIV